MTDCSNPDFKLGNMASELVDYTLRICNKDNDKKRTKKRHIRMMMREVIEGTRTVEEFVTSYQSWRAHVLNANCYKMLKEWDEKIRVFLNSLGYDWKIKGNKVKLYVKDFETT